MSIKLNPRANVNGTHLCGEITTSYDRLVELFGKPKEADGYKVSGEWTFHDSETSETFALYDWKETCLYDPDYPSVAEFRALPSYDWHIGAHSEASAVRFKAWLESKLQPPAKLEWRIDPEWENGKRWELIRNGVRVGRVIYFNANWIESGTYRELFPDNGYVLEDNNRHGFDSLQSAARYLLELVK
jgi:hypothetical protein